MVNQALNDSIRKRFYDVISSPEKTIHWSNRAVTSISLLILLMIIITYVFGLSNISGSSVISISGLILFFVILIYLGSVGLKKGKMFGKVLTFLAYFPLVFVFPMGTIISVWVIICIFKLK